MMQFKFDFNNFILTATSWQRAVVAGGCLWLAAAAAV